ncbi:DUF3105 domain-containing protein [Nakamurella endophytica]|uniref:DUF3105 domain-containing protein n=1 Tax=Nakamurella endophytica TaxID=1748367 RepID=A0A917WP86_9ACTN|nr:DUF3105 domain-containing protein [Nakamurella endophytica]GGM18168.1 hypothetical protein GCM10011594_42810 [Nakamurella endophytica]
MMASGKSAKRSRPVAPVVSRRQGLPWITIGAVAVVVALIAAIFVVVYSKQRDKDADAAAAAPWVPSADNMDPSTAIPGIYVGKSVTADGTITYPDYKAALHVNATQRVAYDRFPPVGGPHDATWAACNGVVYGKAVRDENMVHTLEHGAVWIAYNPAKLAPGDLDVLKGLVTGQTFISMSPYPTLDQPISLQSWGHQLKVQSASDPRVKEFITALRLNQYVYPEIGATCDQPTFDTENPPAFDPSPRGADAIPLSGAGLTTATSEMAGADSGSQSGEVSGVQTGATSGAATSPAVTAGSGTAGTAPVTPSATAGTGTPAATPTSR